MGKWNEEAAPNNNLNPIEIKSPKQVGKSEQKTNGLINQIKKANDVIF